jgi:hypothetical protein
LRISCLLDDLSVQQFAHFRWRPEFPMPSPVMRIFNTLNSHALCVPYEFDHGQGSAFFRAHRLRCSAHAVYSFSVAKSAKARYASVVVGTHGIGLWAMASRSVRQRRDERTNGQNRRIDKDLGSPRTGPNLPDP